MSLGLYIPGSSPVHRLGAGAKLLGLVALGAAGFVLRTPWSLSALLAFVLALCALARLPARSLWAQLRPLSVLIAVLLAFHVWVNGVEAGTVAVLRIAVLLLAATLVTLTTRVSDLLETLERVLRPLRFVGLSPAKVSLVLSLTLRFLPLVFALAAEVREAQRARGLHHNPFAILSPLLVRSLRMADAFTEAMEARGYDADAPAPTKETSSA